jgi:histidyl-tRNA synthetase
MATNPNKLSTEPYKGVRDFYPEEMSVQNYLFSVMRSVAERFGYEEYTASILEPSELYEAKTSEEIVNEQTYSFEDRGGRRVTLRPEMTPSVARMVAGKRRDLAYPLRLYSIPNVFRYERPQRGRLREHWQLNCDIFGVRGIEAEVEIIMLASSIMKRFGARDEDFEIRVNNRRVVPETLQVLAERHGLTLTEDQVAATMRLMDRKNKMPAEEYAEKLGQILGEEVSKTVLLTYNSDEVLDVVRTTESGIQFFELLETLQVRGLSNVVHDPTLVRGFDYYTGTIFEVFDSSPENRRSLFGGGRYDNLLEMFGTELLPTVGFGMGDVTIRDFLETHALLPAYQAKTRLYLCTAGSEFIDEANALAARLRAEGVLVAVDITDRKVGDQIKSADKKKIPFIIVVGDEERATSQFKLKNLITGEETPLSEHEIPQRVATTEA